MTRTRASRRRTSPAGDASRRGVELRDRETVKPLELFFDLVFVLGFTQCAALMEDQPDWSGVGRGLLTLAVIWWAWVCYAWLTSLVEPEEGWVRIVMFVAMTGLLIVALCVPEAFGGRALGFAVAYGVVRMGHIALFWIVSRGDPDIRRWVVAFSISTAAVVGLLVGAAFLDGGPQVALWLLAIMLDWGGGVLGVSVWRLVPAHFAERHNLVIIIALGETIVALGAGATVDLTAQVVVAAGLGMGLAAALWWLYFDVVALITERRLIQAPEGRERNALARDSYSYLHFPMVAGIVLCSLGLHETLAHLDTPLDAVHAFALLGGTAVYLLAHVALRLRNAHTINTQRLALAVAFLVLVPAAVNVDAIVTIGAVNLLLWSMVAYETLFVYDERRYRLRHGLEIDVPGTSTAASTTGPSSAQPVEGTSGTSA
jgi:low temperature requirement protein LtrA